jgi:hypothetical protein
MLHAPAAETDSASTSAGLTVGDWVRPRPYWRRASWLGAASRPFWCGSFTHREDGQEGAVVAAGRLVGFLFAAAGCFCAVSILGLRLSPLVGVLGIGRVALAFARQTRWEHGAR